MDIEPWKGEIEAFVSRSAAGLEWKIVARKSFKNKEGMVVLDNKEEAGDIVVSYNAAILEQLVQKGKISKEIGTPLLEEIDENERQLEEYRQFLAENPQATEEEKIEKIKKQNDFDPDKPDQEKHNKRSLALRYLIALKHLVDEERGAAKLLPLFKRNLRPGEDFGITKAVMDRLAYLPELLDTSRLVCIEGNHYLIQSNLSERSIGLEYHFIAPDKAAAEQTFSLYQEEMGKEALKVLLGFWGMANNKGMFDFTTNISDLMTKTAGEERESYFSVKEKKRFWALTKLLENTKLTITVPYKTGKSGEKKITLEHRLVDVSARDSQQGIEADEYPTRIRARVLNYEEFGEKAQLATAIANGTARLPPQDIMLALTIQTRASQRRVSGRVQFDEAFLIERANLQKTNEANPRVARHRLKTKLNKMQKEKIVDGWSKIDDQYGFKRGFDEKDPVKEGE